MRFFNPVVDRTHEGEELVFRQTGMSMFQLFLRIFPLVNITSKQVLADASR